MTVYTLDDTIAAIATPLGQGGIGIVRLSGPEAREIGQRLFVPARSPDDTWPQPYRLYYGHIRVPETGQVVDEVLLSYMRAPRSFTRQDVVEINAHGGVVALREILTLCLRKGARLAREGEFTLRAFLSGRIDLTQAEAVLDIVCARTEASLRVAVSQLGGRLSQAVREARQGLLRAAAYLEATIDFAEDDIPWQDIAPDLRDAEACLQTLLREAEQGMIYRQGVRTAIVGRPNVGKSSLLNALLRNDRAIVTPIPGTTRDTLEEMLDLQGIPVVLVDTAGLTESQDLVERLGVERSRRAIAQADLVLLLVDGSVPSQEDDREVAALAESRPTVVVVNKSDLPRVCEAESLLPQAPHLAVSALTGEGLAALEAQLVEMILSGRIALGEGLVASSPRHRDLLQRALGHVHEAQQALVAGLVADLLSIDVSEAVAALGEITGETTSEDLLETIFSQFCIGK
jgi:tRNA modification GTPase